MKFQLILIVVSIYVVLGNSLLWPLPSNYNLGSETSVVCDGEHFSFNASPSNAIISRAFDRYRGFIFGSGNNNNKRKGKLQCILSCLNVVLQNASIVTVTAGMDESYTLIVDGSTTATLKAPNFVGALRGLETFSQLFPSGGGGGDLTIPHVTIADTPRFPWRGLMIDTARHFLPIDTILALLDSIAYVKLNVLHIHLVDAESYPFQVPAWPNLSGAGAYDAQSVFTSDQLAKVVAAATDRGIRVVAEVDMPGHSFAVGKGYPGFVATCPDYVHNINNIPLNPANDSTWQMVEGVIAQLASSFSDSYVHLGGDEVVYGCWNEDPAIVAYMKRNGIADANALLVQFIQKVSNMSAAVGRQNVFWEEVFLTGAKLAPGTVIEVWKDEPTLLSVAQAGVFGLQAFDWYFDRLDQTWQQFYAVEPFTGAGWNQHTQKFVLGGEACAWGEQVNQFNVFQNVWPRLAAVAERLWSPQNVTDPVAAQPRLQDLICRLNARGVPCPPIVPGYCAV